MHLLTLFFHALSAGALPPTPDPSPSNSLVNTTAPTRTLDKRFYDEPTIGNFDDAKCHGKQLGKKASYTAEATCLPFTPTSQYVDIYWGDSLGEIWAFPNDHCSRDQTTKVKSGGHDRSCVSVADLGGKVLSLWFFSDPSIR